MGKSHGGDAKVYIGSVDFSGDLNEARPSQTVDMADVTVFSSGRNKEFLPGQTAGAVNLGGFVRNTSLANFTGTLASANGEPISYAPAGITIGQSVVNLVGRTTGWSADAALSDAVKFSWTVQADGPVDHGVSLGEVTAAATADGTSLDLLAAQTTGAVATLHVTAAAGTTLDVTVEDSANDSVFATIGTFTQAAGLTSERIAIAGTVRRYVRVHYVIVGGSFTFTTTIARR